MWFNDFYTYSNITCSKCHLLYYDNLSVIHIATCLVFHERTKHLEIDCHIVGETLKVETLKLKHVSSKNQIVVFLLNHCFLNHLIVFSKFRIIEIYQWEANTK